MAEGKKTAIGLGVGALLIGGGLYLVSRKKKEGRITKHPGDDLLYKLTIRNLIDNDIEAKIWIGMGGKILGLVWKTEIGTEAEETFIFPPGDLQVSLPITLPEAIKPGPYDTQVEIRDPNTGQIKYSRYFSKQLTIVE